MPQVRSKECMRDQAASMGIHSLLKNASTFSDDARRRLRAINELEENHKRDQLRALEKRHVMQVTHSRAAALRVQESLQRLRAYKLVLNRHSFFTAPDNAVALNAKYTQEALRPQITRALNELDPVLQRKKHSLSLVQQCRANFRNVMDRNLAAIDSPEERERKRRQKLLSYLRNGNENSSDTLTGRNLSASSKVTVRTDRSKKGNSLLNRSKSKGNLISLPQAGKLFQTPMLHNKPTPGSLRQAHFNRTPSFRMQ